MLRRQWNTMSSHVLYKKNMLNNVTLWSIELNNIHCIGVDNIQ